jgi:hypothetical protein
VPGISAQPDDQPHAGVMRRERLQHRVQVR